MSSIKWTLKERPFAGPPWRNALRFSDLRNRKGCRAEKRKAHSAFLARVPASADTDANDGGKGIRRMRSHHDMGGLPADTVVPSEHDYALWEKRVDALMKLLSERQLLSTDELRRSIEALGPQAYDAMSYYERWMAGICATLLQRGALTADELGRKMAEVEAREAEAP